MERALDLSLSLVRLCRKQVFNKVFSLGHYNPVLCSQKTKDVTSLLHVFQMFCCAKTRQNLQQGYHCQKGKFLSYMWTSFPFKFLFLNHLRKSTFFMVFLWEIHTSDQSLKTLTVSQLCLPHLNQLYVSKWPASYTCELHLALSTVATLPQLSWGIHCLQAAAFSDLEAGFQSKILHPDESDKRHEVCNSVRKLTLGLNAI